MPAPELSDRKRGMASSVNHFIDMKKNVGAVAQDRGDLFEGTQVQEQQQLESAYSPCWVSYAHVY